MGGTKAIANGLKANSRLKALLLQENNIGDEGAKAIGEGLEKNSTLKKLVLYKNSIGDEGAKSMLLKIVKNEALMNPQDILYLDLSSNNISEDMKKKIDKLKLTGKPIEGNSILMYEDPF